MAHEVETMAFAGQTPWHGLGFKVEPNLTTEEMLVAAKLDWTVSKQPLQVGAWVDKVADFSKPRAVKDYYVLQRDSDLEQLSLVGKGYKPVQNAEAMDFFKQFVEAGDMTMETAGALRGGRWVWALAKIGKDFTLGKGDGDRIDGYLLLASPHVSGYALVSQLTPIRVVCMNTLRFSLGESMKGKGGKVFRMPHSRSFNEETKQAAREALGLATQQMEEFHEAATLLAKKKAVEHEVKEYFFEVMKLDEDAMKEVDAGDKRMPKVVSKFQHALTHAPGQQLPTAAGTWWGALNAVTYVMDHETGKTRDNGLSSAWLGDAALVKRRALDLAIKHAA